MYFYNDAWWKKNVLTQVWLCLVLNCRGWVLGLSAWKKGRESKMDVIHSRMAGDGIYKLDFYFFSMELVHALSIFVYFIIIIIIIFSPLDISSLWLAICFPGSWNPTCCFHFRRAHYNALNHVCFFATTPLSLKKKKNGDVNCHY